MSVESTEVRTVDKSIEELEVDMGELSALKDKLSIEKQALQGQLAELNAKCAVRLPQQEFQRIQSARGQVVKQLAAKEGEIGEVNQRRAEIQTVLQVRKRQAHLFVPSDVRKLVEIRDKWHAFSMDSKNHQKAREVAWKVSQELREFLKPHFAPTEDSTP
jgi:chromosome segregation ATPase